VTVFRRLSRELQRWYFDRDRAILGLGVASIVCFVVGILYPIEVNQLATMFGFDRGPIADTIGSSGWMALFATILFGAVVGLRRRSG
jgi:hypothetical protein